ncbi:MAG: hypothetical protein HC772_18240 [Leptolyngbyaceae cyanobacterium CRU_2_3]|nr:hypothetical protein [Leptolyngbyaceae cyanobacterium CRU_2_3]
MSAFEVCVGWVWLEQAPSPRMAIALVLRSSVLMRIRRFLRVLYAHVFPIR